MVEALPDVSEGSIDSWFIGLVAAVLALLLWRVFLGGSKKSSQPGPFVLPGGVSLKPQALLADPELLLYNIIRMAVQDRYLVFVQVPLWRVLAVEAKGESRRKVLRYLALKQADFVLVHPGSRIVEQVVQLAADTSDASEEQQEIRDVQRLVEAAGIRFTILKVRPNYTVQELEQILGISDPDEQG